MTITCIPSLIPLHTRTIAESVIVKDNAGTRLTNTYFEDEPGRRQQTKRITHADAITIAQMIARTVTDRMADDEPGAGG